MEKEKSLEKLKTLGKKTASCTCCISSESYLHCKGISGLSVWFGVTENINDTARPVHSSYLEMWLGTFNEIHKINF